MKYMNNATLIRRELIARMTRLLDEKKVDEIDRIPLEMAPRGGRKPGVRCCRHKERAILKYRLMAILGQSIEAEEDELKRLSEYASEEPSLKAGEPVLTMIDEACSSCVNVKYFITNACRGCVARPCTMTCRKSAIQIINGTAVIDHEKCINCGLCMDKCPYHAIIYVPVPCEEACPVGAISKNSENKEGIDFDKCIYCGKCMRECPFGAIMERSQLIQILESLSSDSKVTALVAPAVLGQFDEEPSQVFGALRALGFDDVVEVAHGADITAHNEAEEFLERMEEGAPFMTTSCCPSYIEAVEKHIPGIGPRVSETPTPMYFAAKYASEKNEGGVNVFISPCVAKKKEALADPNVDYVLTIEEMVSALAARNIEVKDCSPFIPEQSCSVNGRGFPVSGGVTRAVLGELSGKIDVSPVNINGLTARNIKLLKKMEKNCSGNFVEVMACEGGCVGGPNVINSVKKAEKTLKKYLKDSL